MKVVRNGTVINPKTGLRQKADVRVENGKIAEIGENLDSTGASVIDASGTYVTPGLIDIHVHLRDPGFPEKETIRSGMRAAAAGGFTTIVGMPNTKPAVDTLETLSYIHQEAEREGTIHVYSSAAITHGIQGQRRTDMAQLHRGGAVTFTDDGKSVMDPAVLYEAFRCAAQLDVPISSHCEDHHLVRAGALNRGSVSRQLGDVGIPGLGEDLIVARDLLLAEETGARLHIQHVTTARSVQLVREAKNRGVRVSAEATPHHFTLTDAKALDVGAFAKVNPPLRTEEDVEAVTEGLVDGTLDAISTDHAPHTLEEKQRPLEEAPFGLVGLETSVGVTWTRLVHTGKLSPEAAIAKMTIHPARIMGLDRGTLDIGADADLTLIDPNKKWTVDASRFQSRSKNTPFSGMDLCGKVVLTMTAGDIVYEAS